MEFGSENGCKEQLARSFNQERWDYFWAMMVYNIKIEIGILDLKW